MTRAIKAYNELYDRYKALGEEKEALLNALQTLVENLDTLIANSEGVAGLHLNGDVAVWSELTRGGWIGGWLSSLDDARDLLAELNLPDETQDAPPAANG